MNTFNKKRDVNYAAFKSADSIMSIISRNNKKFPDPIKSASTNLQRIRGFNISNKSRADAARFMYLEYSKRFKKEKNSEEKRKLKLAMKMCSSFIIKIERRIPGGP